MGTRAAAFAAKIPSLQESYQRIMNNTFPQPSPTDISNILKSFSQILLSLLKDASSISYEKFCNPFKDEDRISLFPILEYKTLFLNLVQLLEILPQVQMQSSIQTIGQSLLQTLSCLIPFLAHDCLEILPYLISTSIAVLPPSLHKDLLDLLCYNLLPFTVIKNHNLNNENKFLYDDNYTNVSIPYILMNVFFYTEPFANNTRLIETLMQFRSNILKDIFCVIAYGTVKSKCAAVELLFQYWPQLNPNPQDRKRLADKHAVWNPVPCQYEKCSSKTDNEAVKMCIDYNLSIGSKNKAPFMLICIECADVLYKGKSRDTLIDMLLPMESISYNCENKSCKSPISQKMAVSTCFSIECANYNCSKPVRYCNLCNQQKHSTNSNHMVHTMINSAWDIDAETQTYFIEAIISLLKEAKPVSDKFSNNVSTNKESNTGLISNNFSNIVNFQIDLGGNSMNANSGMNTQSMNPTGIITDESQETMALEERHLLSRYGIWLMTQLCTPTNKTNDEILGRLLAMLFQWYPYTACLPDDQAGSALERLKKECIQDWLMKVVKIKFNTYANCLLPHPMDCSKVSGPWDCWPSTTNEIKEGFKRLICLVPYDVITFEVWNYIMPYWMECFRHEVPEEELAELKIPLSKVLDPDLSPLGFVQQDMYKFITIRFNDTTSPVQEQTLYWIQILTLLEVPITLKLLLDMFDSGVKSLKNFSENENYGLEKSKEINNLILSPTKLSFKSLSKSNHLKTTSSLTKNARVEKVINHKVINEQDKDNTLVEHDKELNLNCFILMLDILIKQMELQEVSNQKELEKKDCTSETVINLLISILSTPWSGTHTCEYKDFLNNLNTNFLYNTSSFSQVDNSQCSFCELSSIWFQLALTLLDFFFPSHEVPMTEKSMDPNSPEIQPLDIKKMDSLSNNLRENQKLNSFVQQPCSELKKDIKNTIIEEENGIEDKEKLKNNKTDYDNFDKLPTQLKLLHLLLKNLEEHKNSDVIYHIVYMIKKLCLHAEVLSKAAKENLDYLSYAQENLLMDKFYNLLQSEFSQIADLAVPLLIHCMILPYGKDKFWGLIREEFNSTNWYKRFTAVERITTIARFLDINFTKNAISLQNSLANAFAYLVQCLDDIESTISQRTLLNLESIRTNSLKLMISCLELQFDTVILDRPIILQTIFQLYNHLCDRKFLTWDFFLNRFDALFLEAQVVLQISNTRDLKNSNVHSEAYQKKIQRAQMALNNVQKFYSNVKTDSNKNLNEAKTVNEKQSSIQSDSDQFDEKSLSLKQPIAPILRRKPSKMSALRTNSGNILPEKFQHFPNTFSTNDNHFRQQLKNEDDHHISIVYKIFEKSEQDQETMHTLVFLLMQFLSRPDQSQPHEEKSMGRTQQIIIKHLNTLLGFGFTEKQFSISSHVLRKSPVFNAVLTSLPKVLDFNYKMGNILAPNLLVPLLIYAPSPYKFVGDYFYDPFNGNSNTDSSNNFSNSSMTTYSLFLLEPQARESWLMSVQILFYKYQYKAPPLQKQVLYLIKIIMNTLESHLHLNCRPTYECNQNAIANSPVRTRSRDLSNESIEIDNTETKSLQQGISESCLNKSDRQLSDETSLSEDEEIESQADISKKSDITKISKDEKELSQSSTRKLSKLFGKEELSFDKQSSSKNFSPKLKSNRKNFESSVKNKNINDTKEKKKNKKKDKEVDKNLVDTIDKIKEANDIPDKDKTNEKIDHEKQTKSQTKSPKKLFLSKPLQERLLPIGCQNINSKIDSDFTMNFPLPVTERLLPIGPSPKHNVKGTTDKSESLSKSQDSLKEENQEKNKSSRLTFNETNSKVIETTNDSLANQRPTEENSDLSKNPLTITTSLPIDSTNLSSSSKASTKIINKDSAETNPSSSPKNQKEKSLSESKVDKVDKFRVSEIKKQYNNFGISTSGTSVFNSSGTSISIDIPEEENTKDLNSEQDSLKHNSKSGLRQYKQKKPKKMTVESTGTVAANVQKKNRKLDQQSGTSVSTPGSSGSINELVNVTDSKLSKKSFKNSTTFDSSLMDHCIICNSVLEEFSEYELDLCITILGTFINREPPMSAGLLPSILKIMSKYAIRNPYSWQNEHNTHIHVPGNIRSVAKQLIRCILQNFSTNEVFQQLFKTFNCDNEIFQAITTSLLDLNELNIISPLTILFKDLTERKHLPPINELIQILTNVANYMECIPSELNTYSGWNNLFPVLESFLRKLSLNIPPNRIYNLSSIIRIIIHTIGLPVINNYKTILEIYSRLLSQTIQQSPIDYENLLEVCHLNYKNFVKERDRSLLARTVVVELVSCIKIKTLIPDDNVMILVQFLLQSFEGTLVPSSINENIISNNESHIGSYETGAQDCCKQHVEDFIDFISDLDSLCKMKESILATNEHQLNEQTFGAQLKAGISQFLAILMTRREGQDHRAVTKYLPWLYTLPTAAQGPKEFLECLSHIRLLSWILIGSMQHTCMMQNTNKFHLTQPIPLEANGHIAEQIQVILTGFPELSNSSVLHMTSLFHAFILCQLWTMYCENISAQNLPGSDQYQWCILTLCDFWSKITPSILQQICNSKKGPNSQVADTLTQHFLNLIEALMKCNSVLLSKLMPMWIQVFQSFPNQLSNSSRITLNSCINWAPPPRIKTQDVKKAKSVNLIPMLKSLQEVQIKMAIYESQSSAVTHLYSRDANRS